MRPIDEADIDDVFQHFTRKVTTYMYPPTPTKREDTAAFIHHAMKAWENAIDATFIIRDEQGQFVGCCGMHNIPSHTPEVGIWLSEDQWGHGYGKQAVELVIAFTAQHLEPEYVLYPVDHRNVASRRIPLSLGGVAKREFTYTNGNGDTLEMIDYWIDVKGMNQEGSK